MRDASAGVVRIPFLAVPADADKPIALSLTYNGRKVRQAYTIGPAYFERAGKPSRSVRIGPNGAPAGKLPAAGPEGGTDGSSTPGGDQKFDGPLQVVGRIVYTRPGLDLSDPADGDFDDPEDIAPVNVAFHANAQD